MTRFALCSVSLFCSFFFYTLFIGFPYGFVYSKLPRPICETKDVGGTKYGIEPNHNPNPFLGQWMGTRGGWKSDWDATWYELAALFLQCAVLFLLPLTTTSIGRNIEDTITGGDKKSGRELVANATSALERVRTGAKFVWLHATALSLFALGVLIMIGGQAISNANFGMAWAEGVMELKKDEFQNLIYDEVRIAELVTIKAWPPLRLPFRAASSLARSLPVATLPASVASRPSSSWAGWSCIRLLLSAHDLRQRARDL